MRQLYTSPRQDNIDRVAALLAEAGIAATIENRSNWNRPTYQRFSYSQREGRAGWAQVWVTRAEDYTRARSLLREVGIEPSVRFADELAASRAAPTTQEKRQRVTGRIRRIVLLAVAGVFVVVMLRYLGLL